MIRLSRARPLGPILRQLRHAAGLSIRQLADKLHHSSAGIHKREQRDGSALAGLIDHAAALGYDVALVPHQRAGDLTPDRRTTA